MATAWNERAAIRDTGLVTIQQRGDPPSSPRSGSDEQRLPPLPFLVVVAVVGAATGWFVIQASPGTHRGVIAFRQQPWYTVWSSLGALFVALWLILGVVALSQVWSISAEEAESARERMKLIIRPALGFLLYGAVVSFLASSLSQRTRVGAPFIPLAHPALRVNFFSAVAVIGTLPSAVGLWMIRRRARSLPIMVSDSETGLLNSLDRFLEFRSRNQRFLAMLSTVVATAVLQTSALRNALIGSGIVKAADYPPEFVFLYGAIFAAAVAIVYLPSELALRQAGRALQQMAASQMENAVPTSGNGVEGWLDWVDQRDRIGKTLGLDVPILARIQTSLGLLAPLIASLIGALVPR